MSEGAQLRADYGVRILIPIASYADREKIVKVLYALSAFKNPLIVLFHVVEVRSRTSPLDPHGHTEGLQRAEERLKPLAEWLRGQKFDVKTKVVLARSVAGGILDEANLGKYSFVVLMKRRIRTGLARIFQRSVSEEVIRSTECIVITTLVEAGSRR